MPWSSGFRSTFPAIPTGTFTDQAVDLFLSSPGKTDAELLDVWPYDKARAIAKGGNAERADPKRFREMSQLLRTVGLAYDEFVGGVRTVRVTPLGKAFLDWRLSGLNENNIRVMAKHAARALAVAQLRNPTDEGKRYPNDVEVFPFLFIWKAMISLDGRITSAELNRAIYSTTNNSDLDAAIGRIRSYRQTGCLEDLGPETITGEDDTKKNNLILIWMGWASFGWTLISKKEKSDDRKTYTIPDGWAFQILEGAAAIRPRHRNFLSVRDYVEHLSACAGIPPDVRHC